MPSKEKDITSNNQDLTASNSRLKTHKKASLWQKTRENGTTILIALIIAFIIRIFIAEPRYIPSESMSPTLATGDRLVIEKVAYNFQPPVRGDIVVFQPPLQLRVLGYEKNQAFIKRAIAFSGETVAVKDGVVYINNQPLSENYIAAPPAYDLIPVTVPAGELFVMGDNRNNSNDSHIWGFLPAENIIGHAVFRFWPLERIGTV
jgi:signal peptidase I